MSNYAYTQENDKKVGHERIEQLKIAFLTEKLRLTSEEAQRFWPVYNQYTQEQETLFAMMRKNKKEQPDIESMTDAQADDIINKQFEFEQRMLDLRKKYQIEFKKVLSPKKVAILYHAEKQFRNKLKEKIHAKKIGKPNGKGKMPPPPPNHR